MSEVIKQLEAMLPRIDAATRRIISGQSAMRVPAEQTDPDLVLGELHSLISELIAQASAAPEQDDEVYPPCDYCGTVPDYHPWHGSGVINGKINPHIHACNECRERLPKVYSPEHEPVAYGDPKAFKNMRIDGHNGAPHSREWMWARPGAGLVPLYARPDAEIERLRAENKRLNTQLQHMIDQTIPLVPIPGDPKWSRRITIDELQQKLAEAQAMLR